MKYLLIAVLFFGYTGFGQVPDSTWKAGDTIYVRNFNFVRPIATSIIKFKSYAQEQAFYRNYGHVIGGFDSSILCKHIYVAVEPEQVESWGVFLGATITKDIVCIKCFHETKQIIIQNMRTMPDTIKLWRNYPPPMNPLRQ